MPHKNKDEGENLSDTQVDPNPTEQGSGAAPEQKPAEQGPGVAPEQIPAKTEKKDQSPPQPSCPKVKVKCESLKGCKKVVVAKDITVQADNEGIIEVDEDIAKRLLSIPGYEKA